MFCYKCGAENDDNNQYCQKCGALINKKELVNEETVVKSDKSAKSIVIVFLVLLIVTCLCLYLINGGRKELYSFSIGDEQGNILMDGGIKTAKTSQAAVRNGGTAYAVQIILNNDAATEYRYITEGNIDNTIYFYLDGELIGSQLINETVTNGMISIDQENLEDAEQLADRLKNTVL